MSDLSQLRSVLHDLDRASYRRYKSIAGSWRAPDFVFVIDHVQGDPFSDPSRVRALVPPETVALPEWAPRDAACRMAAADFLNRALYTTFEPFAGGRTGSGRSGELFVLEPGQQMLERTSVTVGADGAVEVRFRVGLPADGRTILGHAAAQLLTEHVPEAIRAAMRFDTAALRRHVETLEDARALRAQLQAAGLVAFVADGSVLPRASGVSDAPLEGAGVVAFRSPESLRVTLRAPHAGDVVGMGIPRGVTLIVGGGFHGKSTLLRALELGVYDHIPGDGRERVVSAVDAVKVRAEDGRAVAGTDISNFIGRLPGGSDTRHFTTANASGSTSQAAAIAEALEVGTSCLLLDEDTSATNFMIRDARMQALIAREHEPITPFIDRARHLADALGVSVIVVVGGAGDYFDVADNVIAMRDYVPAEVTAEAKRIAAELPSRRQRESADWNGLTARTPLRGSVDASRGPRDSVIRIFGSQRMQFGRSEVDLSALEQLVEPAQTRAIAHALAAAGTGLGADGAAVLDDERTIGDVVHAIMTTIERDGMDAVQPWPAGEMAMFRVQELAAVLDRLRTLRTAPAAHRAVQASRSRES